MLQDGSYSTLSGKTGMKYISVGVRLERGWMTLLRDWCIGWCYRMGVLMKCTGDLLCWDVDKWLCWEIVVEGSVFYPVSDPSPKGQGAGPYEWFLRDAGGVEPGKWFLTQSVRNQWDYYFLIVCFGIWQAGVVLELGIITHPLLPTKIHEMHTPRYSSRCIVTEW